MSREEKPKMVSIDDVIELEPDLTAKPDPLDVFRGGISLPPDQPKKPLRRIAMTTKQEDNSKSESRVKVDPLPEPTQELSTEEAKQVQGGLKEMTVATPVRNPFVPPPGVGSLDPSEEDKASDESNPAMDGYAIGG